MKSLIVRIQEAAAGALQACYQVEAAPESLSVQETKKEFPGDYTLVTFPLSRYKLGAPEQVGQRLGEYLAGQGDLVAEFNVVKGFLNFSLAEAVWRAALAEMRAEGPAFLRNTLGAGQTVVVEYCSPNTNKPLHLGHVRNIVLGDSLTRILDANGFRAVPVCLFNDRGTNISKSMYAWQQAGRQDTPESAGKKGDKFVGDYYVQFKHLLEAETEAGKALGLSEEAAEQQAPSMQAIREMTVRWEHNDPEIRALWSRMNGWVYAAMQETFRRLHIEFDRYYYESDIYHLGKETVAEGLARGIFYAKPDGSVWIDLTGDGLDHKLVLRSDGTSVYITQDLAVADAKYEDYRMDRSIFVVGNEQEYHFKVLFLILQKLGKPYASHLFHLSYGMVELPTGKMKTREGTTVEADDLLDDMIATARQYTSELGKTEGMSAEELEELYHTLGLSALKYFLVKVDPKKRMLFDPAESVDIHGHTGPFVQYAYTRTAALRRKQEEIGVFDPAAQPEDPMHDHERSLLRLLARYPDTLREAGELYNPALVANYAYELAKEFNRFYHGDKILQSARPLTSAFRYALAQQTGEVLREAFRLLGIGMPERM